MSKSIHSICGICAICGSSLVVQSQRDNMAARACVTHRASRCDRVSGIATDSTDHTDFQEHSLNLWHLRNLWFLLVVQSQRDNVAAQACVTAGVHAAIESLEVTTDSTGHTDFQEHSFNLWHLRNLWFLARGSIAT
jgi:hypothetical protein